MAPENERNQQELVTVTMPLEEWQASAAAVYKTVEEAIYPAPQQIE